MTSSPNWRIAAISAAVTLLISGAVSIAYAGGELFGTQNPNGEDAPLPDSAQSSPAQETMTDEAPQSASDATAPGDGVPFGSEPPAEPAPPKEPEAPAPPPEPTPPPMPTDVDCAAVSCVALTFDDGPDTNVTPRVLDTLKKTGTPATFFVVGRQFAGNEALMKRTLAEGHAMGTHSWDHPQLPRLAEGDMRWQIFATKDAVEKVTGLRPTLMRPPYGMYNNAVISMLTESGDGVILWNVDTEDWKNKNAQETTQRAVDAAQRGSIILMHDIHPSTADALPGIIQRLRERGFTLVTVPQLLGQTTPGTVYYSGDNSQ